MITRPPVSQGFWLPVLLSFASVLLVHPFSTNQQVTSSSAPVESLDSLAYYKAQLDQCQQSNMDLNNEISFLKRENSRLAGGASSNIPTTSTTPPTTGPRASGLTATAFQGQLRTFLTNPARTSWGASISKYGNTFDVYILDMRDPSLKVEFLWRGGPRNLRYGSLGNVKRYLEQANGRKLLIATNGGMYNKNRDPQGLLIQNGQLKTPLDLAPSGKGNFYLQPNGVFLIDQNNRPHVVETQTFDRSQLQLSPRWATQSGPMLVTAGQINAQFNANSTNKFVRSGVGIIDEHHVAFIISKAPVNFYHFAEVFRDILGCLNALFLDGVVSRMYCPETGRYDTDGGFGTIITIHTGK